MANLGNSMTLTRQHFKLIADAIATFEPPFAERNQTVEEDKEQTETTRKALAEHFAKQLRGTSPNFDRDRFIRAALQSPETLQEPRSATQYEFRDPDASWNLPK